MFCLNFRSRTPWCSPVPLKFESYNIFHCKKNCRKLEYCVFLEQLLSHIMSRRLHCYEVTFVKWYNKPLLQKSETKIFRQKRFLKKLVHSQLEKKLGNFEIKSDIKSVANNCYIVLNMFEQIFAFHILRTT